MHIETRRYRIHFSSDEERSEKQVMVGEHADVRHINDVKIKRHKGRDTRTT